MLPPVVATLVANTSEFMAKMDAAEGKVKKMGDSSSNFDKLATVGKAALFGVGAAAVAVGGMAIEMADRFEAAHARLTTAVHNIGDNFKILSPAIGATDKAMERLGYTNAETESAVAKLIPATHSTKGALDEMALAANIARGRHIDLEEATQILVKVQTGHVALLGRMGINVKDANGKLIDQHEALKRLAQMYGGDASAYTSTFSGKVAALKATSEDMAKNLGERLIPMIQKVVSVILDVTTWFEKHKEVAIALAGVLGGLLVGAIAAYLAVAIPAAAATLAAAAPFLAVGVAVGALAVAITYLATHWTEVWNAIKSVVAGAVEWVKSHLSLIIDIVLGPLGLAINFLRDHWREIWDDIKAVISAASDIISSVVTTIVDVITWPIRTLASLYGEWVSLWENIVNTVARAVGGIVNGIAGIASDVWNAITNVLNTIWNAIVGVWDSLYNLALNLGQNIINGIINGISSLAGNVGHAIGSVIRSVPGGGAVADVLGLAEGGIVTGPTFALIGEGGVPEGVIPAGNPARAAQILAGLGYLAPFNTATGMVSGASGGAAVGGSVSISVGGITVIQQPGQDGRVLAQQIYTQLLALTRNNRSNANPLGLH